MRFPIIKVKDGNRVHIVGTDSHDMLYIDETTGGIQYLNMQGNVSTEVIDGSSEIQFTTDDKNEWLGYPKIEFVTLEELMELYNESKKADEKRKQFQKMLEDSFREYFSESYVDDDLEE